MKDKKNTKKEDHKNRGDFMLTHENPGKAKSNPWQDEHTLKGTDAALQQSTAQVVQNLPPILAADQILMALLQPRTNGKIKFGDLPNVTELDVSYGGGSAEQPCDNSSNPNLVQRKVHQDKVIEYDKTKGFVSTSWANFMLDPEKNDSEKTDDNETNDKQITTHKEGLFIKHVTSTVINPGDLFKSQASIQKGGSRDGGGGGNQASVNVDSTTFSSANLLSNTWTNVLMYTPKEQVFKIIDGPDNTPHCEPVDPDESKKG